MQFFFEAFVGSWPAVSRYLQSLSSEGFHTLKERDHVCRGGTNSAARPSCYFDVAEYSLQNESKTVFKVSHLRCVG